MATGKHRTTKRSSGGSYASTVSTVVFLCIFILGIWMLNSNSYASSNKSTNRITQNSSARYSFRKVPIAFEDNPGDLPEDAIQPDDGSGTRFDHPGSGSNETKPQVDKQPHVEKEVEEIQMPEENRNTERIPKVDNTTGIEDHAQKGEHQEKKIHKQTHVTGGDKTSMVNNEEQYTSDEEQEKSENDMKMDATGGNDKGGMVSDDDTIQQRTSKNSHKKRKQARIKYNSTKKNQ